MTVKSIAVAAGVGPSVLSSFYRNKAELFAAVMDLPFDPTSAIPRLVAPGLDGLGERLVRLALQAAQDEQLRDDVGAVGQLIPGAVTNTPGSVRAVWEYITGEVVDQVLVRAGIPDAKMRGALITSFSAASLSLVTALPWSRSRRHRRTRSWHWSVRPFSVYSIRPNRFRSCGTVTDHEPGGHGRWRCDGWSHRGRHPRWCPDSQVTVVEANDERAEMWRRRGDVRVADLTEAVSDADVIFLASSRTRSPMFSGRQPSR